jgi:long-chain acyl-CoA synthetase
MHIDFLKKIFREKSDKDALIWRGNDYKYAWLFDRIQYWQVVLKSKKIPASSRVVALEADFSPNSVALLLALIERGAIVVPLTKSVQSKKKEFLHIAQAELLFTLDDNDNVMITQLAYKADHALYEKLRAQEHPGLVLFSSGSTGKNKAAVHDVVTLLEKFKIPRKGLRTITFLLYDHIGGINTLFHTLSSGGCVVTVQDRNPDKVLSMVEKYKVELLPASPTFLNMILLSEAYTRYDLSSLKTISYGTEPMPESTLQRFHQLFPSVRLLQTYGLSEIGILRSQSKSSDSLWLKIGGEGFEIRIVDGILYIKARSAMLGYLNAPSPFTDDGWFNTGDAVVVDGEYIKILGRQSEIINVGGEKVYPAEVESVLQMLEGVDDAAVSAEKNPIMGQIVSAYVKLHNDEALSNFRKRMHTFCRDKLPSYKIPQKVILVKENFHSERFKKMRKV